MRILLAIALLCWVGVVAAVEVTVTEINIPAVEICVVDGKKIDAFVYDKKDNSKRVAHASITGTGRYVVIFDSSTIEVLPPVSVEFIYYHECGHFELGHAQDPTKFFYTDVPAGEHQADCLAVDKFLDKYDENELVYALIAMRELYTLGHKERTQNILSCIGREHET